MNLKGYYPVFSLIMILIQTVICNYVYLGPYVTVSILPAVILFMPLKFNEISDMLIAFVIGMAIDWLSDGVLGLNAAALVAVGYSRRGIIRMFFGNDTVTREESFTIRKNGAMKVISAITLVNVIFLLVYILLDGAGTRSFGFSAARFASSLGVSIVLAPLLAFTLSNDRRE